MRSARTLAALGLALAALLAAAARPARAAAPVPPQTEIVQRLDAPLPLGLPFTDASGRPVRLGSYFDDGRPVILVLGYYRCPNLCGLAMHGLLDALDASGLPRRDYRIVAVSIDPDETPADARERARVYAGYASFLHADRSADAPLDLHLLVGPAASVAALSDRVGFAYQRDSASADAAPASGGAAAAASRYAHAAGIVIVTPQGRTSRYLLGVRFEPRDLRLALVEAASGTIGSASDRLCSSAPTSCHHGRLGAAVMNLLRGLAVLRVLALGGWTWRHRRPPVRKTTA